MLLVREDPDHRDTGMRARDEDEGHSYTRGQCPGRVAEVRTTRLTFHGVNRSAVLSTRPPCRQETRARARRSQERFLACVIFTLTRTPANPLLARSPAHRRRNGRRRHAGYDGIRRLRNGDGIMHRVGAEMGETRDGGMKHRPSHSHNYSSRISATRSRLQPATPEAPPRGCERKPS